MPNAKNLPFSFAMNINTQSEDGGVDLPAQQDDCFSIAMMGDFSNSTDKINISDRHFIAIDRFNFDEIMQSLAPNLSLAMDNSDPSSSSDENNINLSLNSLKDFQPGNLYKNVPVFNQLRDLRKRLNNPATFKQAMLEMDLPETASTDKEVPREVQQNLTQPESESPSSIESGTSLLDSIMDETADRLEQSADQTPSTDSKPNRWLMSLFDRPLAVVKRSLVMPARTS